MKEIEIVRRIEELEDRYPVNRWIMDGRHIWPLVKMILCEMLTGEEKKPAVSQSPKSGRPDLWPKACEYLRALLPHSGMECGSGDVLIYHHNSSRSLVLDDGKRFDTDLDPFTLMLEPEYGIVSLEYMGETRYTNTFRETCPVDDIFKRDKIASRLSGKKNGDESADGYDDFLKELPAELRQALGRGNIAQSVRFMSRMCSSLERILRKSGVKLVIAGCGYGMDTASLFMACKEAGVRCMEVQHGLAAGAGHRWYASWKKMPENGERYEMLPDLYWCWTEKDAEVLKSWGSGRHTVHIGNKPVYSVLNEVKEMTKSRAFSTSDGKPEILFSLQPGVTYPEWIGNVIRRTSGDYSWVLRRHPRTDEVQENLIRSLSGIPNVYADGADSVMLEQLLMRAGLHITDFSTVALDAIEFRVKSILLGMEYTDLFGAEIRDGWIYPGDSEENTVRLIRQLCRRENPAKESFDENAKENLHFLRTVLTAG